MEPVILTAILAVVFLKAFSVPSVASIFEVFYLKYGLKGLYRFKKYERMLQSECESANSTNSIYLIHG